MEKEIEITRVGEVKRSFINTETGATREEEYPTSDERDTTGKNEFEVALEVLDHAGIYCLKNRDRDAAQIFTVKIAELVTERSENFGQDASKSS